MSMCMECPGGAYEEGGQRPLSEPSQHVDVPQWRVQGDWFDVCRCDIPCPCEFAQAPTDNWCQGVLAWHIREGHYANTRLDGLSLIGVGEFEGNLWAGAKAVFGLFIDERADESQREALQMIFGGQAGGWPSDFAETIGELRGIEFHLVASCQSVRNARWGV